MEKKILYLDHLPQKSGNIIWEESIGCKVPFIYRDIKGIIEIIDFENNSKGKFLVVKYNNLIKKISPYKFKEGKIGVLIGKINRDFVFEINTIFKDNRNLTIIDRKIKKDTYNCKRRYYKYHCNECGNEDWMLESNLKKGERCNVCVNPPKKAVLGINTIWDTDRWMVDLGVSEEDAKKYIRQSNKKIKVKCPDCGEERNVLISNIYKNNSIFCSCSDKRPYPEKFVMNFLKQLNIEFKKEYKPNWINNKKYDFYISSLNCIIETHGKQHYSEKTNFKSCGGRSLKEEQANDKYKRETALANGIECYIELDCRESNLEWIKKSILNSELSKLLNLSNVNWKSCAEFANKNIVKEVCEYWNNRKDDETTNDVGKIFGLSSTTIIKYLNKGTKLGWCNYNGKKERSKRDVKKIMIIKGKDIWYFNSVKETINKSKEIFNIQFKHTGIINSCLNNKKYKGYFFKYLDKNNEIMEINKNV